MADIFISYKKEDAGRVIRMVEALRAEGLSVWWDHGIKAGSEWDKSIHQELHAAKVVIAIWSENSVGAPWVKEEATVGKNRGILLPARIDDVEPPLGFMMIQAADLVGWKGDRKDQRWAFFLEAVHAILRGESRVGLDAPVKKRKSKAPVGMILSIVGLVLIALLIAAVAVPSFMRGRDSATVERPPAPAPVAVVPPAPTPQAPPPAPEQPPPPKITAGEQELWDKALAEKTRQGFQSYLIAYPNGAYAQRARDILLTCHTDTREVWKPGNGITNQISRGVGDTGNDGNQEQACAKAKSTARSQAKDWCEAMVSANYRNPELKLTDVSCICNKTGPRIIVCVADMPYSCQLEMKTTERVETCGG